MSCCKDCVQYEVIPDTIGLDKGLTDKNVMTVESPCYNCIDPVDLALHKPNAETEFLYYEKDGEEE